MAAQTVDDYIAELDGWQADAAEQLRRLVKDSVPEIEEAIKWGQPTFDYHGMLCYMKAFKHHINFGFAQGAHLDDPEGLLEGTGKSMRHVKISGPDDVDEAALKRLLASAADLNLARATA